MSAGAVPRGRLVHRETGLAIYFMLVALSNYMLNHEFYKLISMLNYLLNYICSENTFRACAKCILWRAQSYSGRGRNRRGVGRESRCAQALYSSKFSPGTSLGGVPREQKMLKGHPPRVIYHQVYKYTKKMPALILVTPHVDGCGALILITPHVDGVVSQTRAIIVRTEGAR